jgi:hypothetical protein
LPSDARLICVPPEVVDQVWPKIAGLIYVAMKKGQVGSFQPVCDAVLAGRALLWVAWDGESPNIEAAAVTKIEETEWRRVCTVVACGGHQMDRWVHLLDTIDDYARTEKCSAMRIYGRNGWERVLPAYRRKRVILEKAL